MTPNSMTPPHTSLEQAAVKVHNPLDYSHPDQENIWIPLFFHKTQNALLLFCLKPQPDTCMYLAGNQ